MEVTWNKLVTCEKNKSFHTEQAVYLLKTVIWYLAIDADCVKNTEKLLAT
jgi:hypothetical protein